MADIENQLKALEEQMRNLSRNIEDASDVLSQVDAKITALLKGQEARMSADERLDSKVIEQIQNISAKEVAVPPAKVDETPIRLIPNNLTLEQITVVPKNSEERV